MVSPCETCPQADVLIRIVEQFETYGDTLRTLADQMWDTAVKIAQDPSDDPESDVTPGDQAHIEQMQAHTADKTPPILRITGEAVELIDQTSSEAEEIVCASGVRICPRVVLLAGVGEKITALAAEHDQAMGFTPDQE